MRAAGLALFGLVFLGAVVGWGIGMIGYLRIFAEARRAGRSFPDLYFFGTYRYAFNEKKGSRETRMMVLGFAAMVVFLVLSMVLVFVISPEH
jgi:hypothetical protein